MFMENGRLRISNSIYLPGSELGSVLNSRTFPTLLIDVYFPRYCTLSYSSAVHVFL